MRIGLDNIRLPGVHDPELPLFMTGTTGVVAAQTLTVTVETGRKWAVKWGDGYRTKGVGTGAGQTILHTYAAPSAHTVELRAQAETVVGVTSSGNDWKTAYTDLSNAILLSSLDLTDNALPAAQVLGLLNTVYDARAVLPATGTLALGGTNPPTSYTASVRGFDCRAALPGWTFNWNFPAAIKLWCRSDLGITIVTGVSQWADQTAHGNHLAQINANKQPDYRASGGPNNTPYLEFDPTTSDHLFALFPLAHPFSLFMVVKTSRAGSSDGPRFFDGANGGNHCAMYNRFYGSPAVQRWAVHCGGVTRTTIVVTQQTQWQEMTVNLNGNNSRFYQNHTSEPFGPLDVANATLNGVYLGILGTGAHLPCDCNYSEIIVCDQLLTDAERLELHILTTARYGVLPV